MQIGVNFSHREAERLGVEPREAFEATLIHLRPQLLRLSLYWDEAATAPGEFDFTPLHSLLDRAERAQARVLLTVGFKPQRHPAHSPPTWLRGESGSREAGLREQGRLAANLLLMLERAVALLADYDVIDAWEVEHLPFVEARRQPDGWNITPPLLSREIAVVRDVDVRHRPVVVSHPGGKLLEGGWRRALVAADVLGCTFESEMFGRDAANATTRWLSRRSLFFQLGIQARLANRFGRPLWVTELDARSERWWTEQGPAGNSFGVLQAVANAGVQRVYLRGVEEWLAMRGRGRTATWDQARAFFRSRSDQQA